MAKLSKMKIPEQSEKIKKEIQRLKVEWFEYGRQRGRQEIVGAIIDLLELDKRYAERET